MNNKKQQTNQSENTLTEIFKYEVKEGVSEFHVMIHSTRPEDTYEEQLNAVANAYNDLLAGELKGAMAVFKRYFLSDTANQADLLLAITTESSDCALSVVEQPPLDGTKIALWAYLQTNVQTQVLHNGLFEVKHNAYCHLWGGSAFNRAANSEYQTRLLLNDYVMQLMEQGCKLADNCIRTWFFVQNVDVNYAGVVKARNEVFVTQNLTEKTHYIASTGIGGRHADPKVLVQMDTYAVAGLKPEQIHFLYAPTHLNPTYEYGVSFERGTYVDYGDRRQVFISGTASINNKGEVVYPGDVERGVGIFHAFAEIVVVFHFRGSPSGFRDGAEAWPDHEVEALGRVNAFRPDIGLDTHDEFLLIGRDFPLLQAFVREFIDVLKRAEPVPCASPFVGLMLGKIEIQRTARREDRPITGLKGFLQDRNPVMAPPHEDCLILWSVDF